MHRSWQKHATQGCAGCTLCYQQKGKYLGCLSTSASGTLSIRICSLILRCQKLLTPHPFCAAGDQALVDAQLRPDEQITSAVEPIQQTTSSQVANQGQVTSGSMTANIDVNIKGPNIPASFLGISHEFVNNSLWYNINLTAWAPIFAVLGPSPIIRIGGSSADALLQVRRSLGGFGGSLQYRLGVITGSSCLQAAHSQNKSHPVDCRVGHWQMNGRLNNRASSSTRPCCWQLCNMLPVCQPLHHQLCFTCTSWWCTADYA